jgi:hypothetical protein
MRRLLCGDEDQGAEAPTVVRDRGRRAPLRARHGFEGPMTQTPPGAGLAAEVITLAEALGPLPHARQ